MWCEVNMQDRSFVRTQGLGNWGIIHFPGQTENSKILL